MLAAVLSSLTMAFNACVNVLNGVTTHTAPVRAAYMYNQSTHAQKQVHVLDGVMTRTTPLDIERYTYM